VGRVAGRQARGGLPVVVLMLVLVLVEVEGVWHVREVDTAVLVLRRSCRLVGRLMDGKAGLQVIDLLLERPDNLVLVRASRTACMHVNQVQE